MALTWGRIPSQNLGKRVASQSVDKRPAKKGPDVTSMGSVLSNEKQAEQALLGEGLSVDAPMSQQKAFRSQRNSTTSVLVEGTLLDYMLTLLLQSSTRLRDLEATNYYTHVIPTISPMFKAPDKVYQGYPNVRHSS